jgi:hypothetical protein
MKTLNSLIKSMLMLLIVFSISSASYANSEVTLRLNLKKGTETKYRASTSQVITQTIAGTEQVVNQNQIFEYKISVLDKDSEGNMQTQITYTRVAINMNTNGMDFSFDSNDESKSTSLNPQFMGYAALVHKSINAKFSPTGKIIEVSGTDAMLDNMLNDLSKGDAALKAQMQQMMATSFNEETMTQMFGGSLIEYPEKILKVGSSWIENKTVIGQFTLNVDNTYTVKSIEKNLAKIDISSIISTIPGNKTNIQGMDVTFNLFGTQSGSISIDRGTGEILLSEFDQNITGKFIGDMAGQKMEVPMTIASKVKNEIIK